MSLFAQSIHRENDIIISYAVYSIKTKTTCCLRKTACKLDVHSKDFCPLANSNFPSDLCDCNLRDY